MKKIIPLLILSVLLKCVSCRHQHQTDREEEAPLAPALKGIDVSHWNNIGDINEPDARFCYAKASEGARFRDPKYAQFRRLARQRGLKFGAYHYLTKDDLDAQFRNFKSCVGSDVDCLPMLDVEVGVGGKTYREVRKMIDRWSDLCYREWHVRPIIYASPKFIRNLKLEGNYKLWVDDKFSGHEPRNYVIWQHSVKGTLDKGLDIDQLNPRCTLQDIALP